ncbi:hypothetical protein D1007_47474 [Hordeum vulgare]|nr:hypothetical protein D1007_47474 [Hordeum vulgare]
MALSAAGDVAIPELMEKEEVMKDAPVAAFPPDLVGQQWSWSCMAPEMAHAVGGVNWCPTPPWSSERDASPREEVHWRPLKTATDTTSTGVFFMLIMSTTVKLGRFVAVTLNVMF